MKKKLLLLLCLCSFLWTDAQNTFVYFHNNTHLDFTVSTTGTPDPDDWDGFNGNITGLEPHKQMMRLFRDWATSSSSAGTYYVTTTLTFPTGETVDLKIEYDVESYNIISNPFPAITFKHSAEGPGFSHAWRDDRDIYDQSFTVGGVNYLLRYQSYSTAPSGIYDDVLFTIYEEGINDHYTVDPADANDANVLNLMSYNVFMRPLPLFPDDDQVARANRIADYVHDMDAIILQEVFDNDTRATLLSNLATEYPYQTDILDDPGNPLEDGGVVIVSKWPIESEDQYLWGDTCWEDDCTANKGVMYASINKLGKKYHIFGTHMDAFNDIEDVDTRKEQLVEWKNFIDGKGIPQDEAILMGGDFNIDKFANKWGEYDSLWGNFAAHEPAYLGFYSTWDPLFNIYNAGEPYDPEYLDYVLNRADHRMPISATNNSLLHRTDHIDLWRIFDLSDHQPIWGRFVFAEDCLMPENVQAELLTATNVKVTWDPVPGATKYQVRYRLKTSDNSAPWQVAGTLTNEKTITGLIPSRYYEYRVRAECPYGWTDYTSLQRIFTSSCAVPDHTTFSYNAISPTRVKLLWDSIPTATKYQISYRPIGSTGWTVIGSTPGRNFKIIDPVMAGTTYEYRIRALCDGVLWSQYSTPGVSTFTMPAARMDARFTGANSGEEFIIYPNPVDDVLYLSYQLTEHQEVRFEITDMTGRLVHSIIVEGEMGDYTQNIPVQHLPEGIYQISMSNATGIMGTHRWVKR